MKTDAVRFFKFAIFSASAGLIEMGSFALLYEFAGWAYWLCYLIALVLSIVWNFTLNRRFTFRSVANVPKAMSLVFLYYIVFTPLSTWLGDFLVEDLHWNEYLVTGANMLLNFLTEFFYQRFVVYGRTIDTRK